MLVNFSWVREGRVAGMGLPYGEGWSQLVEVGVRCVLSLTERSVPAADLPEALEVLHVPLVDFSTPTLDDLARCVAWIREQVEAERPVVVHCMAGAGRTGTVLAAWLVSEGLEADEAIQEVRTLRPGSIETRGQEEAVRRFAAGREP